MLCLTEDYSSVYRNCLCIYKCVTYALRVTLVLFVSLYMQHKKMLTYRFSMVRRIVKT